MTRKTYRPPFEVTPKTVGLVSEIMRLVGRYEGLSSPVPQPKLRRKNRIRAIQGSLAIEGNTLTEDQVSALVEGRRVVGPKREIVEVQNAIETYEKAASFEVGSEGDLLRAHGMMMKGLAQDAGQYRTRGVGIFAGSKVAHVAPPPSQVPRLVAQLLTFIKDEKVLHPILRSAILHYELEFIHPFSDGNGRVGRLWQHVALLRYHRLFEHVPMESVIHGKQREYHQVLSASDQAGSSTSFIEFSLQALLDALEGFVAELRPEPQTAETRLESARRIFVGQEFSRKDYMAHFKMLSTATASRDLQEGVERRLLRRIGDRALARYRFRKKK